MLLKNPPANAGDTGDSGSIPELGRSLEGGYGNPLQYFYLENPMEWVAMPSSRESLHPRNQTQVYPHCTQILYG